MAIQPKLLPFWTAVTEGKAEKVVELLTASPELADADCREPEHQNAFSHGFALDAACDRGFNEIARILLERGANPNTPTPDPDNKPVFGMPLHHAVCQDNFALANLLLDHGASPHSFPNCDQASVERLFYKAKDAGMSDDLIRQAFANYLPEGSTSDAASSLPDDAPEAIKLFARFIKAGGQPPVCCLVREGQHELITDIINCCPDRAGTPHDHPNSTVFNNIVGAARWYGYPDLLKLAFEISPDRRNHEFAAHTIYVAIGSHNRDGSYADYRRMICDQLKYLEDVGELENLKTDPNFQPHFEIAANFCWHSNYGYRAELAKPEDYIDLSQLFIEHGFTNLEFRDPKSGMTVLARAVKRGHHPGVTHYIKWLVEQGVDICQNDPAETNPMAIAKENKNEEIVKILSSA